MVTRFRRLDLVSIELRPWMPATRGNNLRSFYPSGGAFPILWCACSSTIDSRWTRLWLRGQFSIWKADTRGGGSSSTKPARHFRTFLLISSYSQRSAFGLSPFFSPFLPSRRKYWFPFLLPGIVAGGVILGNFASRLHCSCRASLWVGTSSRRGKTFIFYCSIWWNHILACRALPNLLIVLMFYRFITKTLISVLHHEEYTLK